MSQYACFPKSISHSEGHVILMGLNLSAVKVTLSQHGFIGVDYISAPNAPVFNLGANLIYGRNSSKGNVKQKQEENSNGKFTKTSNY